VFGSPNPRLMLSTFINILIKHAALPFVNFTKHTWSSKIVLSFSEVPILNVDHDYALKYLIILKKLKFNSIL